MTMQHWIWFRSLFPMKTKAEYYSRFSDFVRANIITTAPCWMSFLETMARNSKCNMQELLLIHYQRPEARDCKSYQEWIQSGRQVKRGAIGITVRDKENPEKVRYLFDVADTVGSVGSWRFSRKLEPELTKVIQEQYQLLVAENFPQMIEHAISCLIDDYWYAHEETILAGIMECYKGWDEYAAKMQFVDAAFYSTCYMILERCGYHPRSMYDPQDFGCVPSFYTPNAMTTLGEAIRTVGNQVLDVVEKTIAEHTVQRNNVIQSEVNQLPYAFLKPKTYKKEMEVR